jgi:hypothetical protein
MKKILFIALLFSMACNYDSIVLEEPECSDVVTYENGVKDIINLTCATAGCHLSGGDGTGDYSTYQKMQVWLTDEFFEKVILDGSMPPAGNPGLTDDERETLQCWIEANYPEI